MIDRAFLAFTLAALAILACLGIGNTCPAEASEPAPELRNDLEHIAAAWPRVVPLEPVDRSPRTELAALPDTCVRIIVEATPTGPRLRKRLPAWFRHSTSRWRQQQLLRRLIRLVADEMGAGPAEAELVWRMAIRESSGIPGNVHILSADVEANERAARAKKRAARRRRMEPDPEPAPWASARIVAEYSHRGRTDLVAISAWPFGRGLFGQVTGLHAKRWPEAPPWWLCDPVAATVSVIWAMRDGLAECHGETLRDAHRRFASGRCAVRGPKREHALDVLAGSRTGPRGLEQGGRKWAALGLEPLDVDARADFGDRWADTNPEGRAHLHARLTERARAHGLIPR